MPKKNSLRRTPAWRKIGIIFLLPAIIFIWMTGWILTQIGSRPESSNITQKKTVIDQELNINDDRLDEDEKDFKVTHKPELIA